MVGRARPVTPKTGVTRVGSRRYSNGGKKNGRKKS